MPWKKEPDYVLRTEKHYEMEVFRDAKPDKKKLVRSVVDFADESEDDTY